MRSDAARTLWHRVGQVVERYLALKSLEDESPRPAGVRAELAAIDRTLQTLRRQLRELNLSTTDLLTAADVKLSALRDHLDLLDRGITIADRRLSDKESRGAKRSDAERIAVEMLADLFHAYEEGGIEDYAPRLRDFLITACRLGRIRLPRKDRVLRLVQAAVKVPRGTLSLA
jgi:hypothetical protein